MPHLLADPPSSLYVLLAVLVGLTAVVAFMSQATLLVRWRQWQQAGQRGRQVAALALLAAPLVGVLGLCLCDYCFESDREESVRRVRLMAEAVARKQAGSIVEQVSPSFAHAGLDKAAFANLVERALQTGEVTRAAVWGFERQTVERLPGWVRFEFRGKLEGPGGFFEFRCRAGFRRDPDGAYRLAELRLFRVLVNTDEEFTIPQY